MSKFFIVFKFVQNTCVFKFENTLTVGIKCLCFITFMEFFYTNEKTVSSWRQLCI